MAATTGTATGPNWPATFASATGPGGCTSTQVWASTDAPIRRAGVSLWARTTVRVSRPAPRPAGCFTSPSPSKGVMPAPRHHPPGGERAPLGVRSGRSLHKGERGENVVVLPLPGRARDVDLGDGRSG